MIARSLVIAFVALVPDRAAAQHVHTADPPQAASTAQCAQAQPAVDNIISAATARLETARQSNDPVQMRAAVEHLGAALRDIRTQLAPCASQAATAPHAGHATPKPSAPADPHAAHTAPPAGKAQPPAKAPAKPPATPADPHAGHGDSTAQKGERDPVNGLMVDPAKAPKTTFQGRTYYFSSEASLKQFLENPAKFARPPKK